MKCRVNVIGMLGELIDTREYSTQCNARELQGSVQMINVKNCSLKYCQRLGNLNTYICVIPFTSLEKKEAKCHI